MLLLSRREIYETSEPRAHDDAHVQNHDSHEFRMQVINFARHRQKQLIN